MGSRVRLPLRPTLVVALLTVVAAAARFVGLTAQSFWLDEYLWTQSAARSASEILRLADGYPPLFGLLVHALLRAGLASDWWLRAPAAVAGTLTVPLTYAVGRRLAGRVPALAAAALVAVNPLAIWYSQECGAYALLVVVALASTLAFLRLLAGGRARDVSAYAAALVVGFGLHYYFAFVVVAQAAIAARDAVRRPERRLFWAGMALVVIGAFAPWARTLLYDVGAQAAEDVGRPMSLLALPYTALTFVGGFSLGPPLRRLHGTLYGDGLVWSVIAPYSAVTVAAVAIATALALLACARRWTTGRMTAALLVAVPVLGPWVASLVLVGYRPRYAIAALPLAVIWCASALRTRFRGVAAALLLALAALQLTALGRIDAPEYAREDTRAAATYVAERDSAATVVLVGDAASAYGRYAANATHVVTVLPHDVAGDAALRARLGPALATRGDVWLLTARPWTIDPDARVRATLDRVLTAREEVRFAGVALRRYDAGPTPTAVAGVGALPPAP